MWNWLKNKTGVEEAPNDNSNSKKVNLIELHNMLFFNFLFFFKIFFNEKKYLIFT